MINQLQELISRFGRLRIGVLGDFLLDDFVFGEISRVSREAPVLILRYLETSSCPGGGANTVHNVATLGAQPVPLGFLGQDEGAELLLSLWPQSVERQFLFREPEFRTTRKARILAGSVHSFRQQVVRLDYEYVNLLTPQHEETLLRRLEELISGLDALIISDYSLGSMTPRLWAGLLKLARRHGKPVMVDSRDRSREFRGATTITPNISEVESALSRRIGSSLPELEDAVAPLRSGWELESLLVTRGKGGMSLFEESKVTHIPIFGSDQVADVTGAGDTVIAAYTTAVAGGGSFLQAALLANRAGGLVVMKRGTASVAAEELTASLAEQPLLDFEARELRQQSRS